MYRHVQTWLVSVLSLSSFHSLTHLLGHSLHTIMYSYNSLALYKYSHSSRPQSLVDMFGKGVGVSTNYKSPNLSPSLSLSPFSLPLPRLSHLQEGLESPILRGEALMTGSSEPLARPPWRANSLPNLFQGRQLLEPIIASPYHLSPSHNHTPTHRPTP